MIVIYHSADLDGIASAAICKKKYPDAKLIGYDYWQELPWDEIPENQDIIMVDVSIKMPEMARLAAHSNSFTWIDHHASAIAEFETEFPNWPYTTRYKVIPVLQIGMAGCELTWNWLFHGTPMPEAIKLLGTYDVFRQADPQYWEERVLPFQWGMRLITSTKIEKFPVMLLDNSNGTKAVLNEMVIDDTIKKGETILKYQSQQDEAAMRGAFEVQFQGLKAIACNIKGVGSLAFNSVYKPEQHDLMVAFGYGHGKWAFSLRTTHDHVDVSLIAKQFGGGGHAKAAGFAVKELTEALTLP